MAESDKSRGRIKRNLPSMTTETYDNEKHGGKEDRGSGSSMVLNVSNDSDNIPKYKVIRGKYDGEPLYCRLAPALSMENPTTQLRSWRKSDKLTGFTPFFCHLPAVASYFGHPDCPKVSFVLHDPTIDQAIRPLSPFFPFINACSDAHKASIKGESTDGWKLSWNKYMVGSKNKGSCISWPKDMYLAQGGVYKVGPTSYMIKDGKPREVPYGLNPGDPLVVLELSASAGQGLQDLMNIKRKDAEAAQPGEYRKMFLHDPLGVYRPKENKIVGGKIVAVFNPRFNKKLHPEKEGMARCTSWDGKSPEGGENGIWKYQVALLKSVKIDDEEFTPDLEGDAVDEIFNKSMPWFDMVDAAGKVIQKGLVRVMTPEEQLDVMARCFAKEPGILIFGLNDHPEWLKQIKPILVNAKSFVNPGEAVIPADTGDDDDDGTVVVGADDDELPVAPKKKKKAGKDVSQPTLPGTTAGDDDEDPPVEEEEPVKTKKGKTPPPPPPPADDDDEEEEEDEDGEDEDADDGDDGDDGDDADDDDDVEAEDDEEADDADPEAGDADEGEAEEGDEDDEEVDEEGDEEEEEEAVVAPVKPKAGKPKSKPSGDEVFDEVIAAKPVAKPAAKPAAPVAKPVAKPAAAAAKPASKKGTQTEEAEAVASPKKKDAEMANTLQAAKAAAARAAARKNPAATPPPAAGGKANKK